VLISHQRSVLASAAEKKSLRSIIILLVVQISDTGFALVFFYCDEKTSITGSRLYHHPAGEVISAALWRGA
jgi:hypothetical protein